MGAKELIVSKFDEWKLDMFKELAESYQYRHCFDPVPSWDFICELEELEEKGLPLPDGCLRLGYGWHIPPKVYENCCLCAHHLHNKEFGISAYVRLKISSERLANELKKCVCLCHNCHAKIHSDLVKL
jgi:hypothetical protein